LIANAGRAVLRRRGCYGGSRRTDCRNSLWTKPTAQLMCMVMAAGPLSIKHACRCWAASANPHAVQAPTYPAGTAKNIGCTIASPSESRHASKAATGNICRTPGTLRCFSNVFARPEPCLKYCRASEKKSLQLEFASANE